jgi:hypothetical protein
MNRFQNTQIHPTHIQSSTPLIKKQSNTIPWRVANVYIKYALNNNQTQLIQSINLSLW